MRPAYDLERAENEGIQFMQHLGIRDPLCEEPLDMGVVGSRFSSRSPIGKKVIGSCARLAGSGTELGISVGKQRNFGSILPSLIPRYQITT